MITRQELADALIKVGVKDLMKETGVSMKTIYRLRNQQHCPGIDMAARLYLAAQRLHARTALLRNLEEAVRLERERLAQEG